MAQCFINKSYSNSFESNNIPKLLSVSKVDESITKMPRVMHKHDDQAEIVFIKYGSGLHTIGGKQYETRKGDILLFNSGVVHDECTNHDEGMSVYGCSISDLQVKGLPLNYFIDENIKPVIQSGEYFSEIENIFEIMYTYALADTNKTSEITNYLLRALLVIIFTLIEKGSQSIEEDYNVTAIRIKNYIDAHCLEDINLYTMSKDLNMSQYYLAHVFKEMYGYSPIQYVIRRRIGEAQSLLISTDYGITTIATMVGFNNSNYFNTTFVRMVGMTPGRYRKYWVEEQSNSEKSKE